MMNDSFNYASFSNALFIRGGNRKAKQKRTVVIGADEFALAEEYRLKHYPPYLWQDAGIKTRYKE